MSGWAGLTRIAAIVVSALLLIAAVIHQDKEAGAIGLVLGVIAVLMFRSSNRVLVIIAALLFANVAFWMATATISNLETREGIAVIILPLALAIASVVGLLGVLCLLLLGKRLVVAAGPTGVAAVAVMVFAVLAGLALVEGSDPQAQHPGDVVIRMHNTAFSTRSITTGRRPVNLYVTNDDLFWHTVTIDKLSIDLKVPVGGKRRISISGPPGSYTFYCRIPGHAQAGMKGTITIP